MNKIEDLVKELAPATDKKPKTYTAEVSHTDEEGIVWVRLPGAEEDTPTASTSAEVKMGDTVNVEWRNNKLYIAGNYSNPSAGVARVEEVEQAARIANEAAQIAVADANTAQVAAESAQASAASAETAAQTANTNATAAQAAAQTANENAAAAQTAAQTANTNATAAQTAAENAQSSADNAAAAAANAQTDANTAKTQAAKAISDAATAKTAAENAQTSADNAQTSADAAQASATTASEYAARALGNLSTVQSVTEALAWITQHGTMTLTTDTELDPTHVYFVQDSAGDYVVGGQHYAVVSEPSASALSTYYVLSIDESLNNYVSVHLAVTDEGLWLLPDAGGNKVLIATGSGATYTSAGTYIIGAGGTVLASFLASGATIGQTDQSHIEMDYHSLQLKDKEGDTYFFVSDLRKEDGTIDVNYTGDGETTDYSTQLEFLTDSPLSVTIGGVETTDFTLIMETSYSATGVRFNEAPASGAEIVINYEAVDGKYAKAYTAGFRKDGTIGMMSFAEGVDTLASGRYSHAEGFLTEAFGDWAHAEGSGTFASDISSHAEGERTIADGLASHAEGSDTQASYQFSHAEGEYSHASGIASHAEGFSTYASGNYSHAQNERTNAYYRAQTAIGKYNDNKQNNVFEIGNGTAEDARSNAFTVDWQGNTTASGSITDGSGNVLAGKADTANVYTKAQTDTMLAGKANTSDVYTKTQADALLADKANTADIYNKTETNTLLAGKADASDVYTKTQTDTLLTDKADASDVYTKTQTDAMLANKADASGVYTKTQTDAFLADKADASDVYTKTETDTLLADKANASDVYSKTETNTLLADKADTADLADYLPIAGGTVTGSLAAKNGQSDTQFETKGTSTYSYMELALGGRTLRLVANSNGNVGVYDPDNSRWIVRHDTGGGFHAHGDDFIIPDSGEATLSRDLIVAGHSSAIGDVVTGRLASALSVATATGTALCSVELGEGTWQIIGQVRFPANNTGVRRANIVTTANANDIHIQQTATQGGQTALQVACIAEVTATSATYYLNVYHNAGAALSMPAGTADGYVNGIRAVRIA